MNRLGYSLAPTLMMNSPFERLKHFIPDKNHPQENHATECLAACLVWSPKIRNCFLNFLFQNREKLRFPEECEVEVITQEATGDGYLDLVLRSAGEFVVAVEVKIGAPENCAHHVKQLKNYRRWLHLQKEPNYLFTLVRDKDPEFDSKTCGADGFQTWRELHKHLRSAIEKPDFSEVEKNLMCTLCEYLESEGIVSTYQTKDFFSYANGLKAQRAVKGILNQVDAHLQLEQFDSAIDGLGKEDEWPRLRIHHPYWDKIFGKAPNRKLSLWFEVEGVWDVDEHDFSLDFDLWEVNTGNHWSFTKKQLPKWFAKLQKAKCKWSVDKTWNRELDNLTASEIDFVPKRICAYLSKEKPILKAKELPSEDKLVATLVNRVKEYSEIISSLK